MAQRDVQPLYLITDGSTLRAAGKLIWAVEQALIGGDGSIRYVQLREQISDAATDDEVIELGKKLLPICREYQAHLIVSRRPDLAVRIGADGVNLGCKTVPIAEARAFLGNENIIGYSAHSAEEAQTAFLKGADYVLLGPVFPPLSKRSDLPPLGLNELAIAANQTNRELFALGGITAENCRQVNGTGVTGAAVITAILGNPTPSKATRSLLLAWNGKSIGDVI